MSETESHVGSVLLKQLEFILDSDPSIDEVGFIHPSQFLMLNDMSSNPSITSLGLGLQSTEEIIEQKVQGVNSENMSFWIGDHKLGISTQAMHLLYDAAKHAFMVSREEYKRFNTVYVNKDGSANANVAGASSSPAILESETMKHSRVLLLLSCDFGTAWNFRKEVVLKKDEFPMYIEELLFSALVLSYSPKSEQAWCHRRWVIKKIAGNCLNLGEILEKESELVKRIAEKSKMNYRAWNHRCWLVSYMPRSQVLSELINYRDWAGLHVADSSCFHYRTRLMLRMLEDPCHTQDPTLLPGDTTEIRQLWKDELCWIEMLIKRYIGREDKFCWNEMFIMRYIGREALWNYRRFLSLSWIKHFITDACSSSHQDLHPRSGKDFDLFMINELQLVRSCATLPDNLFEDYQSQALFSATYILWLIKQLHKSYGIELRKLIGDELELLLNKVCPEKAFLWNFWLTEVDDSGNIMD